MARILALSSQVVSGHVGLSAIQPVLQWLGHEVLSLPTILLSNHPGLQRATGTRIEPTVLDGMMDALADNGRLHGIDAILTGYLPSVDHVSVAGRALDRCRAIAGAAPLYLCDPVLGDDPKGLYIEPAAAAAIRDHLLPQAHIITPNRYELAWLSELPVTDSISAVSAARALNRPLAVATSIPAGPDELATLAVTGTAVATHTVRKLNSVPNGTGDLLSALYLSAHLSGAGFADAFAVAARQLDAVIANSAGARELALVATLMEWRKAASSAM